MCKQTLTFPRKLYSRKGSEVQFPGKLHDMMMFVERECLESIISWADEGRAIMINDPEKLVQILPLFFGQTKYRSFRRQLNMWRFERIGEGPLKGAFTHPLFLRGQKALCAKMSRHLTNDISPAASSIKKLSDEKNHLYEKESSSRSSLSTLPCHLLRSGNDDDYLSFSATGDILDSAMSAVESIVGSSSSADYNIDDSLNQNDIFNDGDLVSFAGRQFHFLDFKRASYDNHRTQKQQEPEPLWSHGLSATMIC